MISRNGYYISRSYPFSEDTLKEKIREDVYKRQDFCKILNVDDEEFEEVEGDADSLAGLLLEIKGDFQEQTSQRISIRCV